MLDPMKGRLVGKNVLITGGAGRIGSATAKSALNEGAQVVLADISAERLEGVVSSLPASTRSRVHSITADVTSEAGITKLIDHAAYRSRTYHFGSAQRISHLSRMGICF